MTPAERPPANDAAGEATPARCGYRWPAEWEPHAGTWLSWPHNQATWPGKFAAILPDYARFVRTLADTEPVQLLAGGDAVLKSAEEWVGDHPNVTLHPIATNDAWTRDHGPTFLAGPAGAPPALLDWGYNAWGGKYPPFDLDDQVPRQIAEQIAYRRFAPGIVLEGGAIDGNGRGLVMTTASCLLNSNRNGPIDAPQIEAYLADYLGAVKVLWLDGGHIAGDDTDGHIDQLARFVNERTVVIAVEDDPADENYRPLQTNWNNAQRLTDQRGRALELVPLPMPRALHYQGHRLPASYANFYIANGVVIVPAFDDPADARAVAVLAELFPARDVIGLPATNLAWGLGAFHCLSQQQPMDRHG